MPRSAVGTRLKRTRDSILRPSEVIPESRQVRPPVNYEVEWKEAIGRHADIANIFMENPRSKMKKRDLRRMLDEIWDILPERVQVVKRDGLPESQLFKTRGGA